MKIQQHIISLLEPAPLRLLGKTSSQTSVQGILQIYYNGDWGTICRNGWSLASADIACKQLGYRFAVMSKHLGIGFGPIWLNDVKCNGYEPSLDQCHNSGWDTNLCGHYEDVGIVCNTSKYILIHNGSTFSQKC